MNGLHAIDLRKIYAGNVVLDLDIQLRRGLLYTVLGPNGSGKSTLLRMLSLVEAPDAGRVVYTNNDTAGPESEYRRKVVLTPDRAGLFHDTVFRNAEYGLRIRNVPKKERAGLVEEVLRSIGLWGLRKANALTISSGEAQRLCLAMALVVKPEVVLLDEPTSSLDPGNVAMVEEIISGMKDEKRLIVMVTHNLFQARRLADRVVFLYQGRLIEESSAHDFFTRPQTDLGKSYISGDMVY